MFNLFGKRNCPACGHKMYSDGNNLCCGKCGMVVEIKNKRQPKKHGYRTAYDRDHDRRTDSERDE